MSRVKAIFVLLCCALVSFSASAQLRTVQLNTDGTRAVLGVTVKGVGEVVLDIYGNIKAIIPTDRGDDSTISREYYSNHNSYETGKIKSIEGVEFAYYSNFNSYEAGKIKSIGSVKFTYYSKFNDYEASKIKTIGGESVKYYSNFNDYESGKIKSISGILVNYYSKFNDYEAAKIKSVGSRKYEYLSNSYSNAGLLKSGDRNFVIDGIRFIIKERLPFNY